jgi:hypothetical protein
MKPDGLTKMLIHDDEGAAIAYTRDGIVYDLVSGARIAKLHRAGSRPTPDDGRGRSSGEIKYCGCPALDIPPFG